MARALTPTFQDVSIPATWSGSTVFTVPAGAADVALTPPAGSSSAVELAVRPLSIDGSAISPALAGSDAGTGPWVMRAGDEPTRSAITYDAKNDSGGALTYVLSYWS